MQNNTFRALISGKSNYLVRLSGPITEVADFMPVKFKTSVEVEVDLAEVTALNSVGIREFSTWANGLENKILRFSHCPKFFVDQLNMVANMIPARSKVLSFYVPYYSARAETERMVLFRKGLEFDVIDGKVQLNFPEVNFDDGSPMEIDVIPHRYFRFLDLYG